MIYLKNDADTEDIFQTVFLKYVLSSVSFENDEHEKAWFIRVTINACKDLLRNFFRSHTVSLDEIMRGLGGCIFASAEIQGCGISALF